MSLHAGHGGLMSLCSPAPDTVQQAQSAACAARQSALTDSAHRLAGHMRGADDGENRPPNRPMRASQPMKKRCSFALSSLGICNGHHSAASFQMTVA